MKIHENVTNGTLLAIDLKGYQGKIYVSFEEPNKKRKFCVIVDSQLKNTFLFTNITPSFLHVDTANCEVFYQIHEKTYDLSKDQDFDHLPELLLPKTKLMLQNDFVLMRKCRASWKSLILDGNNHTIYVKKSILSSWLHRNVKFQNVQLVEIDHILSIKHFSDLNQILQYPNSKVVAFLTQNIKSTVLTPVSLEKFYGTLILLGNGYVIDHVRLKNVNDKSIGLISSISSNANFFCKDFHLSHVSFPEFKKESIGVILGEKRSFNTKYMTVPGYTCFQNCSVSKTYIPNYIHAGIFAGKSDEFTDFFLCFADHILGLSSGIFMSDPYFDEEHLTEAKHCLGEKRIVIPTRALRKESK